MRYGLTIAGVTVRRQRSNMIQCQRKHRQHEYFWQTDCWHDAGQNQSKHNPRSSAGGQLPKRVRG